MSVSLQAPDHPLRLAQGAPENYTPFTHTRKLCDHSFQKNTSQLDRPAPARFQASSSGCGIGRSSASISSSPPRRSSLPPCWSSGHPASDKALNDFACTSSGSGRSRCIWSHSRVVFTHAVLFSPSRFYVLARSVFPFGYLLARVNVPPRASNILSQNARAVWLDGKKCTTARRIAWLLHVAKIETYTGILAELLAHFLREPL